MTAKQIGTATCFVLAVLWAFLGNNAAMAAFAAAALVIATLGADQ